MCLARDSARQSDDVSVLWLWRFEMFMLIIAYVPVEDEIGLLCCS
jgi:hypothetical protein